MPIIAPFIKSSAVNKNTTYNTDFNINFKIAFCPSNENAIVANIAYHLMHSLNDP